MSGEPRYLRVERDLASRIRAGEWDVGDFLPSEIELQDHYRVSRTTVRRAVQDLVSSGLLVIERGNGTRVGNSVNTDAGVQMLSFAAAIAEQGMTPGVRGSTARMATNEGGARGIHLQRVHTADDEPISVSDSWLDVDQFAGVPLETLSKAASLYEIFTSLDMPITEVIDHYGIATTDEEHADLLGVGVGQALLQIDRTARSGDQVVETGRILVCTERYRPTIITRS